MSRMNNGILDELMNDETDSILDTAEESTLTSEDRCEIICSALKEVSTPEEYNSLMESANLWEIYGVLPSAETALESAVPSRKKVVSKFTKQSYLSGATKKASMKLAKNGKDPNYDKYIKYRDLMRVYREKVFDKWGSKASREAKKMLRGAGSAAASVKDVRGRQMEDKIKLAIDKVDKDGRNHEAIKK